MIGFISLGPGDPELITLKALKHLQNSDIIFCPGERSCNIVRSLEVKTPVKIWEIPMSKNREKALDSYDQLYEELVSLYNKKLRVVIVGEGDAGFYSSIHYLYDKCVRNGLPVYRIAGIPAFIVAGALSGLHIVKQEEKLHIIPGKTSPEEIESLLVAKNTIVIMKLSMCQEIIKSGMTSIKHCNWYYFENIGEQNQVYLTDISAIRERDFPYFSLMIIKPAEEN